MPVTPGHARAAPGPWHPEAGRAASVSRGRLSQPRFGPCLSLPKSRAGSGPNRVLSGARGTPSSCPCFAKVGRLGGERSAKRKRQKRKKKAKKQKAIQRPLCPAGAAASPVSALHTTFMASPAASASGTGAGRRGLGSSQGSACELLCFLTAPFPRCGGRVSMWGQFKAKPTKKKRMKQGKTRQRAGWVMPPPTAEQLPGLGPLLVAWGQEAGCAARHHPRCCAGGQTPSGPLPAPGPSRVAHDGPPRVAGGWAAPVGAGTHGKLGPTASWDPWQGCAPSLQEGSGPQQPPDLQPGKGHLASFFLYFSFFFPFLSFLVNLGPPPNTLWTPRTRRLSPPAAPASVAVGQRRTSEPSPLPSAQLSSQTHFPSFRSQTGRALALHSVTLRGGQGPAFGCRILPASARRVGVPAPAVGAPMAWPPPALREAPGLGAAALPCSQLRFPSPHPWPHPRPPPPFPFFFFFFPFLLFSFSFSIFFPFDSLCGSLPFPSFLSSFLFPPSFLLSPALYTRRGWVGKAKGENPDPPRALYEHIL